MNEMTTIRDVARHFDTDSYRYDLQEEKRFLTCTFSSPKGSYRVTAQVTASGRIVTFIVREFDYLREQRRQAALEALMYINYTLNHGAFGVDQRDGEVVFQVGVGVADVIISYEQYDQSLRLISYVMNTYRDVLKMVIWAGMDPRAALDACEAEAERARLADGTA